MHKDREDGLATFKVKVNAYTSAVVQSKHVLSVTLAAHCWYACSSPSRL